MAAIRRESEVSFSKNTKTDILFQGEKRELIIKRRYAFIRPKVSECEGKIIIYMADWREEQLKAAILNWYRKEADRIVRERVAYFSNLIEECVGTIRIKEQKSRWGSCSGKGNLNFNWRLILAPPEVLDYVVVHELCHLKFMNHSSDFWFHVSEILPDYKRWNSWLKQNGNILIQYEL